jgi:hypothetical protein
MTVKNENASSRRAVANTIHPLLGWTMTALIPHGAIYVKLPGNRSWVMKGQAKAFMLLILP